MSPFLPRDQLATHEVRNQALPPGDANLFGDDAMLRGAVAAALSPAGRAAHWAHLDAFGAQIGQESVRELGRLANENRPKFKPFDRYGHRIDEIEFHPAYHELMGIGQSAGLSARAWTHPQGGHVAHAALLILMGWADGGVCCPLSMTYAVVRLAEAFHVETGDELVAINARHAHALAQAKTGLVSAGEKLERNDASELVASDLRMALEAFGQVSGKIDNEIILNQLFASFCIGK